MNTPSVLRLTAAGLALGLALGLSACTTEQAPARHTPTAVAKGASTPRPDPKALYGAHGMFLSDYVAKYPAYVDPVLLEGKFVLEKSATGPSTFPLPRLSVGDALVLAIFCDAPSKYDLTVVGGSGTVDRTWGDSCGPGNFALYTTAPITGPRSGLQLSVSVASGTSYRVSAQETKPPTN